MTKKSNASPALAPLKKERKEWTCGNCGFVGNSHEHEVHAATKHYPCDDPECSVCRGKSE